MHDLLLPARERARSFRRGTRTYDAEQMGYADEGSFVFDTSGPGNANIGHEYGVALSASEKRDLIEFMKQL